MRARTAALTIASTLAVLAIAFLGHRGRDPAPLASAESAAVAAVAAAPTSSSEAVDPVRERVATHARRVATDDTRLILRWAPLPDVTITGATVSMRHLDSDWRVEQAVHCERGIESATEGARDAGRAFEGVTVDGAPAGTSVVAIGPFVATGSAAPAGPISKWGHLAEGRLAVEDRILPEERIVAYTASTRVELRRGEPLVVWIDVRLATPVCVRITDSAGSAVRSGVVRLIEDPPGADHPVDRIRDAATLGRGSDRVDLFRSFPDTAARVEVRANHCDPVAFPLPPGTNELSVVVDPRASLLVTAIGVRAADGFRLALVSGRRCGAGALRGDSADPAKPSLRTDFDWVGAGSWDLVLRWRSRTIGVLERVTLARHERRSITVDASRFGFAPVEFQVESSIAAPGCVELTGVTTDVRRVGTVTEDGRVELHLPRDRYRVFLRRGRDLWPADRELVVEGGGDAGVLRFR